jgi:hypothetical protein
MKFLILVILSIIFSTTISEQQNIVGKYYSVANAFEKSSAIDLTADGKFIYRANRGGCQYDIEGTYSVSEKIIHFKNHKKYTSEYLKRERDSLNIIDSFITKKFPELNKIGNSQIPDFSLVDWKIGSNFIKPLAKIDCGCFTEKSKFKKVNAR